MIIHEKHRAYELYVQERYSMSEVAKKLKLDYGTVRRWAELGKWKEVRNARSARPARLRANYLHQCCELLAKVATEKRRLSVAEVEVLAKFTGAAMQLDSDGHIGIKAFALKKFGMYIMDQNLMFGQRFNAYKGKFIYHTITSDMEEVPALMPPRT